MIALMKLRPYTGDTVAPSPNRGARRAPGIQGIVLHATEDDGDEALSLSWMRSPRSRVSCHLLVSRAGRVTRLVGDRQRAWHAGLACWRGTRDVNSITLGIEIANRNDGEPYTRAQYRRVTEIVAHYCRQGLSLHDVVSHGEIAAGRKTDPHGWDWARFHAMVRQELRGAHLPPPLATAVPAPGDEWALELPDEPVVAVVTALPDAPVVPALPDIRLTPGPVPQPPIPQPPALQPPAPRPPAPRPSAPRPPVATATPVVPAAPHFPTVIMPKLVLYSRTVWLNGLTVLASGGMLAAQSLDLAHRMGITMPEVLIKWALFVVGVMNILLRLRTTRPLTCSQGGHCSPGESPGERPVAMGRGAPAPGAGTRGRAHAAAALSTAGAGEVRWQGGSRS